MSGLRIRLYILCNTHVYSGTGDLIHTLSLPSVTIIPPMLHTNLQLHATTRVGTLIVVTIYLQLIQSRYMFRRFTVLYCSHQHCVQPVVSDVEVVGYL